MSVRYQLEESYESPDRWLRCVEGDAKSLIGPGRDGYLTASEAMSEHWQQEHGGRT